MRLIDWNEKGGSYFKNAISISVQLTVVNDFDLFNPLTLLLLSSLAQVPAPLQAAYNKQWIDPE